MILREIYTTQNSCIAFYEKYTNKKNKVEKTFEMCYSVLEKGTVS